MNFGFSIDALNGSGSKAWRLQRDLKHWRSCTYAESLQSNDALLTDAAQAETWVLRRMAQDKDFQLAAKTKAGMFDFLMRGIFAHAVLHRLTTAPIPDKQQMIQTIRNSLPGTPWLLYLNISGHFRAIDTQSSRIIGNLDIAVRGEIASSPDYIGPLASDNDPMMGELYHQFLAGWLEHLTTSNMAVFVPDAEKLKEESFYLEAIDRWQPEPT
ncbi:MAG: hypothetical protein CO186_07515 [Zetaproteobacteria bacterium CG_4_9_14_3_um_filter_49_83]|nr:MAG: hypothetical protein AUJ56_05715 [Zetaproteobacteria bacterium CG1_02_49_23]PIQ30720.1 MAG: hypothetical protein COW62_11405 [Zetaproteobacteria bacterium CG17_big_fil_post_rev_8_21_14_2_50_50_13]PIV30729.1 MAG: hypothetical protein COS35_05195 [Zetaproteobacteria bacterium CG02_land_8_20_14_3_00_50_9]PIY56843.1 MAG: hypothetical protein COZ00_01965 [Zetaproteobacteria bacterium CG_4_10_14_0_8_um_filter_49_80]PJA35147.1 MAG: hypothetical protein CO186_07515 [Zetaproteobacteria bacterium